jgi:hypothetical protein
MLMMVGAAPSAAGSGTMAGPPKIYVAMQQFKHERIRRIGEERPSGLKKMGIIVHSPKLRVFGDPLRCQGLRILLLHLLEIDFRRPVADLQVGILSEEAEVGDSIHFRPIVSMLI